MMDLVSVSVACLVWGPFLGLVAAVNRRNGRKQMARTEMFLAAKKYIRLHPQWSDNQVAVAAGIPPALEEEIVREARRDVAAGDGIPSHRADRVGQV